MKQTVLALFLLIGSLYADKPNVVVLDFSGDKNSTKEQLRAISDKFQTEIVQTDLFKVLDRNQMDAILKEQGFQQSGACSVTDCQIEMGQLLGVEKMVSANVINFGEEYSITLQYIDVATGVIETSFSFEVKGKLIDVLKKGCPYGAQKLAGYVSKKTGAVASNAPVVVDVPKVESQEQPTVDITTVELQEQPKIDLKVTPEKANNKKTTFQSVVQYTLYTIAATGVVGGVYFHIAKEDEKVTYDNLPANATEAEYNDQWDKVSKNATIRNVFLGVGGAALAGSIIYTVSF